MTTWNKRKRPPLGQVEILKREDQTEDLALFWLNRPENYSFKPGQYCTIGYGGVERAYSISSSPHEEVIELFVELVPEKDGGVLTPMIWDLDIGDKVTIRPRAKGIFTFKDHFQNQLFIATVTGVVPYVSIVRNYLHLNRSGHHFFILEGASYMDEFVYDKEFQSLSEQHPNMITFIPSVSRPDDPRNTSWKGLRGRVNNIVEEQISSLGLSTTDTMVYACGHPGMIEDVKHRLVPEGFEFLEERFWKED